MNHDALANRIVGERAIRALCLSLFLVLLIGPAAPCFGQPVEIIQFGSSPNPVGSGARALGMGGAFIAVADDATAASWNPGGLIQLENPEISAVGSWFHRRQDDTFGTHPEASGAEQVSGQDVNYASAAYPFRFWGRNMIVSLNYQRLYDFTQEARFRLVQSATGLSVDQNVDFKQDGQLAPLGLAYCVQITPGVSFGFTLNFWDDDWVENGWERRTVQRGAGVFVGNDFVFEETSFDRYTFRGFNANLGVLWRLNETLTLGAVIKTPFEADLRHTSRTSSSFRFPSAPILDTDNAISSAKDEKLDMPLSYGLGLAFRFSDAFTASVDVYRTQWDDFVRTDAQGNRTSLISGLSTAGSDVEATNQVRMGGEYLIILNGYAIPVRGGVFYDPSPSERGFDEYYGFSFGSGLVKGPFVFDVAYQFRFGNDVGSHLLESMAFSQDVKEHTVYASLIVHF